MPAMTNARRNAVIGIVIAAVLGSIISTLGGDGGEELGGLPTFAWLVIIAFVVNITVFVPSFLAKTEHYYDLTGSLTYLTVTLVALAKYCMALPAYAAVVSPAFGFIPKVESRISPLMLMACFRGKLASRASQIFFSPPGP